MNTNNTFVLLEAVGWAVRGVSEDPEIRKKMHKYGLTPQRVQEGERLTEQVKTAIDTQGEHYAHSRRLSHQIKQDSEAVRTQFMQHVAIAKTAFLQEPRIVEELKIKKVNTKTWGWTQQALDFYQHASARMERLQRFGATPASFQQNETAVKALLTLKAQRMQRKGKAENSTQERNQKVKELRAWYGEFRKLARIAFQETPQMLETFGIMVPSTPRKRKPVVAKPIETEESA